MIIPLLVWVFCIPASFVLGWVLFNQYVLHKVLNNDPKLLKLILKIRNSSSLKDELFG